MKTTPRITTSLVICTYNWPEALELTLLSAARQTVAPTEIVIADDGSTSDTRSLIDRLRPLVPCPVKHVWQEDQGFRRAMAMNRAFAACTADYVIQIDGDIIMERHFIEDHIRQARRDYFLAGGRAKLTEQLSNRLYAAHRCHLHWWMPGVIRRQNVWRLPWLAPLFRHHKAIRGCNLSFWRDDLFAVNGYDSGMVGYGSEDTDLTARLTTFGLKKRYVKFCCLEYHLYHPSASSKNNPDMRRRNIELRVQNERRGIIHVDQGISSFLHPEA